MIMRIKSTAFLYGKDFNDGDTLKIKKHTYWKKFIPQHRIK
jgi:hypothetical protein